MMRSCCYRRSAAGRRAGRIAWLGLLFAICLPLPAPAATVRVDLGEGLVATIGEDRQLYLEALPEKGEGLWSFSRRLCGAAVAADGIAAANRGSRRLLAGVRYRVPFEDLLPEYQLRTLRALFADDRGIAEGWEHQVSSRELSQGATLWHIAQWFTGHGEHYRAIREHNRLLDDELEAGQMLVIPASLLRPVLRGVLPNTPYPLEYGGDSRGEYAVYRLQPGEALYSSVVVRFTGRVYAEDVNTLAGEIAVRSGIRDVTDIPVGYEVRIPFELLLPEFLPAGHPRRREYEESVVASARFSNPVRATHLQGITVILDAGHGGKDVGASVSGVWESLYVYDIMLRVKDLLEKGTAARVIPTVRDGGQFRIEERDVLPFSRGHAVLTDPAYPIEDSTVGVHLRWYLANSAYRQAVAVNGDAEKVIFISIHADSLHSSLRGAMVYIPGANWRGGSYGKSGTVYASRREFQEGPRVSFSQRELIKSEGLSRQLAQHLIDAFARGGLSVHPFKPVREKVIRRRRSWVPAVLRYNAVPAQVLVEVGNLANPRDRELMQTRGFRQRIAEAIVRGILGYYGYPEGEIDGRVVSARR